MRTRLSIQELEAVVDVAETLSFRQSAARCFVSQPALSRTIASAESKLGTRLFDRNTRHVALTAAGRELLPVARRIVFELRDSLSDLSEFVAGRKGEFTIASVPAVAGAILPEPMQEFLQHHPHVSIRLQPAVATEALAMVADGTAQIGFCSLPPNESAGPGSAFHFTPFATDELVLVCSERDPLARRRSTSWKVFEQRPFIATGSASSVRPMLERQFDALGLRVKPRYESTNISVSTAMVAAGLGIAVIPTLTQCLVNPRGLAFVRLVEPPLARRLGVVVRRGRSLSRAAELFLQSFFDHHTAALEKGRGAAALPKGFKRLPLPRENGFSTAEGPDRASIVSSKHHRP